MCRTTIFGGAIIPKNAGWINPKRGLFGKFLNIHLDFLPFCPYFAQVIETEEYIVPIYEYQCDACEHKFEILQKISDDRLTVCPDCNEKKLRKLVTAAAFHLKGTGWYETDFKDKKPKTKTSDAGDKASTDKKDAGEKKKSADSKDSGTSSSSINNKVEKKKPANTPSSD